ncbi:CoA ester lyase [Rhizobacter sp. Root404]|uniref:HpcH/HpaI aldolase/citrate lyase family protein n=1 Tax=Rhizobacter sp. Root404 TaxID=1736528 RepID=UPI0006FA6258|nr:aldolase [Rhizobacter sp. Root404]
MTHPRDALFDAGDAAPAIPVCDHYCGVEARMRKSLALQAEMGPVFDVTLDCEDGAPVGGEAEHARMAAELVMSSANAFGRVGARVHPVDHPSFADDVATLVARAGTRLAYLMVPKPRDARELQRACAEIDHQIRVHQLARPIPVHALIETHGALRDVAAIAANPRIESLSFGLMDFVSAHRGAIPASAMGVDGQFTHPLVVRAKLEIAAACHGFAKVPSHCVVTEFNDERAISAAATRAAREFGYARMWSIHPNQIEPIVEAFAPSAAETDLAIEIITAAQDAQWAPISHRSTLHDRASYRYFWQVLERAKRTGQPLPANVLTRFFPPVAAAA